MTGGVDSGERHLHATFGNERKLSGDSKVRRKTVAET